MRFLAILLSVLIISPAFAGHCNVQVQKNQNKYAKQQRFVNKNQKVVKVQQKVVKVQQNNVRYVQQNQVRYARQQNNFAKNQNRKRTVQFVEVKTVRNQQRFRTPVRNVARNIVNNLLRDNQRTTIVRVERFSR